MEQAGSHFPTKEKLHTDILEQKYGSIHSEVLRHDTVRESIDGLDCIREARLVDEKNILRTYALTFLTYDKNNTEIAKIDDEIRNGGLIGKTFREHGYVVKKNVIDVFLIDLPQWMAKDFQTTDMQAKARITEFYAKKGDAMPVIYGNVLEIYSPDFKDPKDGINDIDKAQVNPITNTLAAADIPVDEVWQRLDKAGETNEWDDVKDKYEQAQKKSQPLVAELHRKINEYLKKK